MAQNNYNSRYSWLWITLCSSLFIALAGYKFFHTGVPFAAEKIAQSIPPELYRQLDKHTLAQLDDSHFSESQLSLDKQAELSKVFAELLQNTQAKQKDYQLVFRQWQQQPNALALANGTIVITDSLVHLAKNNEQLRSVLLHEIGHIEHNHIMEGVVGSSIIMITFTLIFGDMNVLGDVLINGSLFGIKQAYSRQAEQQADDYAANIMRQRGSIDAMHAMFDLLSQYQNDESSWLSSHAGLKHRMESLK